MYPYISVKEGNSLVMVMKVDIQLKVVMQEDCSRMLSDRNSLVDLINKLFVDLLNQTRHLARGASIFHCRQPPSISVFDYLKSTYMYLSLGIAKYANCSSSVFIAALIYIDRIQQRVQGFIMNDFCAHRLVICAIMVASKFWDDFYYKNQYYAKIGGISKQEINLLELQFLNNLNYSLLVSEGEFTIYLNKLTTYQDSNASRSPS